MNELSTEADELIVNFVKHFRSLLRQAKQVPEAVDFTDIEIGRCALQLAAKDFSPLSPPVKDLLKRLNEIL